MRPVHWFLLLLIVGFSTGYFTTGIEIDSAKDKVDRSPGKVDRSHDESPPICRHPHSFKLHDGKCLPMVGLGVAESDSRTYQAVKWAISDSNYRLVDTASHESYGNEDQVGQAVRDVINANTNNKTANNINRQDVFVTTKLWDDGHGFEETIEAFEESLENLGLDYIDLYLIHSPFGGYLVETYDALLFLQEQPEQLVKSIGVSNFGIKHLEAIRQNGTRPVPAVNQFEIHPLLFQQRKPLLEYCQQHKIQVQAFGSMLYGTLSSWEQKEPLKTIMTKHPTKTSAQILLRWAIQHNIAVIPKSTNQQRIFDNIQVFDFVLDEDDMNSLDDWGNTVSPSDRLMYKEDWNWNPIDEAEVHEGETNLFPEFEGYQNYFDGQEEDDDEDDDYDDGDDEDDEDDDDLQGEL